MNQRQPRSIVVLVLLLMLMLGTALTLQGCSILAIGDDAEDAEESPSPTAAAASGGSDVGVEGETPASPQAAATPIGEQSTDVAPQSTVLPVAQSGASNVVPITVLQSYFYKPPLGDETATDIAEHADLVILTKDDEPFRDEVREHGYDGTMLQYIIASEANGPSTAITTTAACDMAFQPWSNQVTFEAGDFCRYLHPNEDWFLHNGKGERLYNMIKDRTFYHMNPNSQGWRIFLINRLTRLLEGDGEHLPLGYDGIFLDNVELSLDKVANKLPNSDGIVQEFADDAAYRDAWLTYLEDISDALHPRWSLWANLISDPQDGENWNPYLEYLDGGMSEEFATGWPDSSTYGPQQWDANLTQAEYALAMGKGYIAVSQGADEALHLFGLASYLLITDGQNAFFRYSQNGDYDDAWYQHSHYQVNLGLPLGPRYQRDDGQWQRDFANGSVIVDPRARTAEIVTGE